MSASSADRSFAGMEVDGGEVPYVPGDFEGASGRVDDVLEMHKKQHKCEVCSATFAHWDHFAYCGKSGKVEFHQDSVLSQVKQKASNSRRSGLERRDHRGAGRGGPERCAGLGVRPDQLGGEVAAGAESPQSVLGFESVQGDGGQPCVLCCEIVSKL
jgi:ribosomal protein S27AE